MNALSLLFVLFFSSLVLAPAIAQDGPPNAEPGKCYAESFIPDRYATRTEMVMVKPAEKRYLPKPPKYKTEAEVVLVQPEQRLRQAAPPEYRSRTTQELVRPEKRQEIRQPAAYETVSEQYLIREGYRRTDRVAPIYEMQSEQEMVRSASVRWERRLNPNCVSANPNDCYTWEQVEEPAEYQTVKKRVLVGCPEGYTMQGEECLREVWEPAEYGKRMTQRLKNPETVKEEIIPAEYRTVTVQEQINEGEYLEEIQPAAYQTVVRREVSQEAGRQEVIEPPAYQRVERKELISEGGYFRWVEVLCRDQATPALMYQIYQSLQIEGYQPGPTADALTPQAREALRRFQKERGLPQGHLDFETLAELGIRFNRN